MSADTRIQSFFQGLNYYGNNSINVITLSNGKTYLKIDQDGNKLLDSSDVVSHNVLDSLFNLGSDTTDLITTRALFDTLNGSPLDGYFYVVPTASELIELSQRQDSAIQDKNWFSGYVWSSTKGGSADTHIAVISQGGVTSQKALSDQTNASVILELVALQSETAKAWKHPYLPNVSSTGYPESGLTDGDRLSNNSLIWVGVPDINGAVIEVSQDNGRTWAAASNGTFKLVGDGDKFILTRQRFSDGSVSIKSHEFFTLDTEVKAPTLTINDLGIVTVSGLDQKPWKWEYSSDQGVSWNLGKSVYWWEAPQNWTGSLSLAEAPNVKYIFRQTDAAGNTSQAASIQYSPPTYKISSSSTSVNEGASVNFTLTTTNVAPGSKISYSVSGVTGADISGGLTDGFFNVGADGSASVTITLLADKTTEGEEILSLVAQGLAMSVAVNDTSTTPVPTYSISHKGVSEGGSVNEGETANFNLVTTNLPAGSSVPYTITGDIVSADISGGVLSGNAIIDATGKAVIPVQLLADNLTEGAERLTLSAGAVSAWITVNDTSITQLPTYKLTNPATVREGNSVAFTLQTTNVVAGTVLPYAISGDVNSADITGGHL